MAAGYCWVKITPFQTYSKTYPFSGQYSEQFREHNKNGKPTFRLQHISEIRKTINDERRKQTDLSKKYHRYVKVVTIVDDVLAGFTMGLGSVGLHCFLRQP